MGWGWVWNWELGVLTRWVLTLLILFTILGRTQGEEDGEESWNR
jgi:hypothetical protein